MIRHSNFQRRLIITAVVVASIFLAEITYVVYNNVNVIKTYANCDVTDEEDIEQNNTSLEDTFEELLDQQEINLQGNLTPQQIARVFTSNEEDKFMLEAKSMVGISSPFVISKYTESLTSTPKPDGNSSSFHSHNKSKDGEADRANYETIKTIFDLDRLIYPNAYTRSFKYCRINNCRLAKTAEAADAVIAKVWRIRDNEMIPFSRQRTDQIWVMFNMEAPSRLNNSFMLDLPKFRGTFNWTMSYRLDADIPQLYGKLIEVDPPPEKNYEELYTGKRYHAAWFVSHCRTPSSRFEYARRLSQLIDVHIYGLCGTYSCNSTIAGKNSRGADDDVCLPLLSNDYYFYLAFENSLCKDYVTEKFFKLFKNVDVVPVVRGGANYHKFFPPDTFIDAADFSSPEELGKYLIWVAKNKEHYIRMLKEKNKYRYTPDTPWQCRLCEKLHKDKEEKRYPNLRYWYGSGQCHFATDL